MSKLKDPRVGTCGCGEEFYLYRDWGDRRLCTGCRDIQAKVASYRRLVSLLGAATHAGMDPMMVPAQDVVKVLQLVDEFVDTRRR